MTPTTPLGIADIISMAEAGVDPLTEDHWYWCRRHERAEHVSQGEWGNDGQGTDSGTHSTKCVRMGPCMSEREANLVGHWTDEHGVVHTLGMEVEQ